MFEKLRSRLRRPTPATAIALLALFVALGGTGYAALKLPKNSVGTKQLKNNAVTGAKVKNGSLSDDDFGGTLPTGATGPKGDAGAPGQPGTNGTNGTNGAKGDKGDDGNDGDDGDDGTNGTQGPTGPSGTVLKAKVTAGPQDSGMANIFMPLNVATFTPAANKAELVLVRVNWTAPGMTCNPTPTPPPGGQVVVKFDGAQIANQVAPADGSNQTLETNRSILSSASPTSHTVSVEIADNCTGTENATINTATVERIEFG